MLYVDLKTEFLFDCESRKLSEKTVRNYGRQIDYLGNYLLEEHNITDIADIQPSHIKSFLLRMKKHGRKVNYINDLLKAYKVLFRYAYNEGYTTTLITEKVHNMKGDKTIIRAFSEAESKRLINFYSGNDYISIRNKVMMLLFTDTGIRMSELIGLTEDQIKQDYIIIRGKGAKERVVPKSPLLAKWLMKFQAVRRAYFMYRILPDNLFLSRNARPLTDSMVDRIIKEAGQHCDVSPDIRISAHTMRHTYAQYQLRHGMDIYTLSRLLGHENIAITQTYLNGIRDDEVLARGRYVLLLRGLYGGAAVVPAAAPEADGAPREAPHSLTLIIVSSFTILYSFMKT